MRLAFAPQAIDDTAVGETVLQALLRWDASPRAARTALADELATLGAPALPVLARLLAAEDRSLPRGEIARAIGAIGGLEARAPLVGLLATGSPDERIAAVAALARLSAAPTWPALLAAVDDPEPGVSAAASDALTALARAHDLDLAADVADALEHAREPRAYGRLLGRLGGERAADELLDLLDDSDTVVAGLAGVAIAKPACAGPVVLEVLRSSRAIALRKEACIALGALRHEPAAPDLIELLGDADAGLAANAWRALQAIAGRELAADAEIWLRWWEGRFAADDAAGGRGDASPPPEPSATNAPAALLVAPRAPAPPDGATSAHASSTLALVTAVLAAAVAAWFAWRPRRR